MSNDANAGSPPAQQTPPASGGDSGTQQTVSAADFQKVQDRAFRMEGLAKDWEKKFGDLEARLKGVDLEEYKTLKSEKEKLQEELAKNNPEEREKLYSSREAKLRKDFGEQIEKLQKDGTDKDAIIKNLRVTRTAMAEVGPLFHPNCHRFVEAEVEKVMDYQDGQIVVKDEKGIVLYSKITPGALMTPKEWADEFAKQYPQMAVSTVVGGGRQATSGKQSADAAASAGGANSVPANFSNLSKAEQTEYFRKNPEALKNFKRNFSYSQ